MRAAQAGDTDALERVLRRHYDRILAVCRRITGDHADACDAAQEAMISIVRGLHRFDERAAFGTWVYRIATNASLDELRRRKRRPVLSSSVGGDDDPPHPDPVDSGALLDEAVTQRAELDAALAALPAEFRVPVVLRDVADLDYAEIAEVLDIPIGTVKSRIARGRAQLAALLADGNPDGPGERPRSAP